MTAMNLILYSDKPKKKALKTSDEFSKLSRLELNPESVKSFNDENIILLFDEMFTDKSLKNLMSFLITHQEELSHRKKKASLITNIELSKAIEDLFHEIFRKVADIQDRYLHNEELVDVLRSENKEELAIGAAFDKTLQIVTLTKGDLTKIAVPYSFFYNVSEKLKIDSLELSDFGQTIKFGKIEISFDSVLYEYSEEYRKKLIKKRRTENRSFGACLRRYRQLKEIKQSDFKAITEKEIGRIENEKVMPHKSTIKSIIEELGITEEDLLTY